MPIEQDFIALQETVYAELRSTQDRIRNLIGNKHWLTEGEHKEELLRNVLRSRLPEDIRIGKGFVCIPSELDDSRNKSTGQIDILITARRSLTLYKQGDLVFVTPDTVEAVIEVKTKLYSGNLSPVRVAPNTQVNRSGLVSVLKKLSDQVQLVRDNSYRRCWAGLYVYEQGRIDHRDILRALQISANGNEQRAIDCIAWGPNAFIHYWPDGRTDVNSPIRGPVWHSYHIERLAPAYFVNNVAIHVSPETPYVAQYAWFPIQGGKETRRYSYASLQGDEVHEF